MSVKLRVLEGETPGAVYVLARGESRVFGRHRSADIVFADRMLSRHHVMVRVNDAGAAVALDLDSLNGTFLNDCPIQEAALQDGDRLRIGSQVFLVELDRPPAPGGAEGVRASNSTDTVPAICFCSKCRRAVEVRGRPHAPWKAFVCERCAANESATVDPRSVEGWTLGAKVRNTAYGPVFEATQDGTGRRGLVKLISPEKAVDRHAMELFAREASIGKTLAHPSIVALIDTGERNGIWYLIEERPEGTDLAAALRERGALPPLEAILVAREVARALAYAAERQIVHRNVQPAAIFLIPDAPPAEEAAAHPAIAEAAARAERLGLAYRRVKLGDFGLAKPRDAARSGVSGITKAGEWKGVINYVPPEQLSNAAIVDQRADVYALGATLYHMVSGHAPYEAPSPLKTIRRIGEGDLTPLKEQAPAAPAPLVALVERAMERDPSKRVQEPAAMLTLLDEVERAIG